MQFPLAFAILSLLASITSTVATPIKGQVSPRDNHLPPNFCRPNFEGAGVSVTNSAVEWGTHPVSVAGAAVNNLSHRGPMLAHADFRFEQNGQYPTRYIIKDVGHHHLAVAVENNKLLLRDIDANDQSQVWDVTCDECSHNIGSVSGLAVVGCNITSTTNDWCVTTDRIGENALFLKPCDGTDEQNFDFWTPISF